MHPNVYNDLHVRLDFRNTYFRRSFKSAKVHGGLLTEGNSIFNLGLMWAASQKIFSLYEKVYGAICRLRKCFSFEH